MIHSKSPSDRGHGETSITVLVIDDSDVDRHVMCELLTEAGFSVYDLPSAIGATRAARQLHARVVVIDQNLPALDGNKLALLFHENPALRSIRVVLVSGGDERAMLDVAQAASVDAFVSKRTLRDKLVEVVKRLAHA